MSDTPETSSKPQTSKLTFLPVIPPRNTSKAKTSTAGKDSSAAEKEGLEIPQRRSSMQTTIPIRTSSRKREAPWGSMFANKSLEDLQQSIPKVRDEIDRQQKRLKPSTSFDSTFWSTNINIAQLQQDRAAMESRLGFLELAKGNRQMTEEEWESADAAQKLKQQYLGYSQKETITTRQVTRLEKRAGQFRDTFFWLFTSAKTGLNISTGVGTRDSSAQSNFVAAMRQAYCPSEDEMARWDPVLGERIHAGISSAAHLYPWRQVDSMDAIFGKGSRDEIFSPLNGLFLHTDIEKALDYGFIAIVPDTELEPRNPLQPLDDLAERQQRIKDWESQPVKDYKVVVIDAKRKEVSTRKVLNHGELIPLSALHGRRLQFKTDFRPRARYVWWTFLSAVLQAGWRAGKGGTNPVESEVRKTVRYWGSRGPYVKKNMLLGFVEELGQDVDSILENSIVEEEDGPEESDPHGVAIATSEIIRKAEVQEKTEEDSDEDEDGDYDEDDDRVPTW